MFHVCRAHCMPEKIHKMSKCENSCLFVWSTVYSYKISLAILFIDHYEICSTVPKDALEYSWLVTCKQISYVVYYSTLWSDNTTDQECIKMQLILTKTTKLLKMKKFHQKVHCI